MTDADRQTQINEVARCLLRPDYFIDSYCQIEDPIERGGWIPFRLWEAQRESLQKIADSHLTVILKARQLGMTWLLLGYALWKMIFRASATVLLFSRRDDEAVYLLDDRLKGMWKRLPEYLTHGIEVTEDNAHEWGLSNGSIARAFPTGAGDSYTATLAIVDEADLVPDLNRLMNAVKPTIDAGGQMVLLSRVDKSRPESEFKRIYRGAKEGKNGWTAIFLPWHARPERTQEWYEAQKRDILSRTGSLDDLYQQYPATDVEALAPNTLDKRIAPVWLQQCYVECEPVDAPKAPALPNLRVYVPPQKGHSYVIGADPAEGNPTSDPSAITVLDANSGEEVAQCSGRFQPSTVGAYIQALSEYYNRAPAMVERNNHGHAVLLWLKDNTRMTRLTGWDDREGWLSNSRGKALLYNEAADAFRDNATVLHSFDTFTQLSSIDGSTLSAPPGQHDDLADSYALALCGRAKSGITFQEYLRCKREEKDKAV